MSSPTTSAATGKGAMSERIAVYPGSFDPIHNGHLDLIERCVPLYDRLVIAVLGAPKEEYSYLSSRLVKEVFSLGGDLSGLVPEPVLARLRRHFDPAGSPRRASRRAPAAGKTGASEG